jgi:ectoine hydroxylase-related dioxygenase (phytanoyl-CoA dioxygenase family)
VSSHVGTGATLAAARAALRDEGYVVLRAAVPPDAVAGALRRLNLAIRREGLTPAEVSEWSNGTFFPHLRWEPEVWAALPEVAAELLGWQPGDDWADPQLLLRFPDEDQPWDLQPHVDTLPEWAGGRTYRGIVGVALTPAAERDGAPCVWPGSHRDAQAEPVQLTLSPGDALVMHPQLGHSGRLNLGPAIRAAIYFRLLAGDSSSAPG